MQCAWKMNLRKLMILTLTGQSQHACKKFQVSSMGFKAMTSAIPVQCSNQQSHEATQICWAHVFPWKEWWVYEMFAQCGWEMNLRNDPHTCWTITVIILYVHLKNFRCLQQELNLLPLQCQCSAPTKPWSHLGVSRSICWAQVLVRAVHQHCRSWV